MRAYVHKLIVAIVVGASLLVALPVHAALPLGFPKRANYFLSWKIDFTQAQELAKWDLLILDAETQENSRDALRLIRRLNPHVIILAYVTSQDMRDDIASLRDVAPLRYKRYIEMPESWYLHDDTGKRLSWWPRMQLLNVSSRAPVVNGEHVYDFLARHVVDDVLSTGLWDGVMYDNAWNQISYFAGNNIDIDNDGARDANSDADTAWRDGMEALFRVTRARAKNDVIIVGNGHAIAGSNGVLYENFPANGWTSTMQEYRGQERTSAAPYVSVVNSNTGDIPSPQWYQTMRFGLGSTLLGNGFYSFDDGAAHHESLWWYDEYDAYLGAAVNLAYRLDLSTSGDGLWRRDFGNGVVVVNANATSTVVHIENGFEAITGNGAQQDVTLAPHDARVLVRRVTYIPDVAYRTGMGTHMLTGNGREVRTRFIAPLTSCAKNGMQSVVLIDGTCVASDGPTLTISNADGMVRTRFAPFGGAQFTYAFATLPDRSVRIVTAAISGDPRVRVWSLDGKIKYADFLAYASTMHTGVNVAVGDVDHDGALDIVTGTGNGAGPQVRVFSMEGVHKNEDFFAYDAKQRMGVRVAAGDVNGDGKDDIVVVPAAAVKSADVRLFLSQDRTAWQRIPFTSTGSLVYPVARDIDTDGRADLLLQSDKPLSFSASSAK